MTILRILKEALTGKYVEVFKNGKGRLSLIPFFPNQTADHTSVVIDVVLDGDGEYASFCVVTQDGEEIVIPS